MQDRPYFMENKEWYGFNYENKRFYCTDKAPDNAKKSLKDFYKTEKELTGGKRKDS